MEVLCLWKNQERKKDLGLKTKKEKKILSRKETNSFVKATGTGGAPRWRPDFKQRSCCQTKFAIHNVKSEVSFSLYKPLYKNIDKLRVHQSPRIWKAVRGFVVLLFSTVSDFPTSLRDFPLPLATLLIIVMSSSSLH